MPDLDPTVQETPFVLDDRSLETQLADIQRYVRRIPFTGEAQEPGEYPAADPQAEAQFGYVVSISADGGTMAVGAPYYRQANDDRSGAVYLFDRDGLEWKYRQTLTVQGNGYQFGWAVSLDRAGETLVVGARAGSGNNVVGGGAAYVYMKEAGNWGIGQPLEADLDRSGDEFGHAVSVSGDGDILAVSALKRNFNPYINQGVVYVYRRSGSIWTRPTKLGRWPSPNGGAEFGHSVSLNEQGTVLAVGARVDTGRYRGSITLFKREADDWNASSPVVINDFSDRSYFGYAISLSADGNTLAFSSLHVKKVRTYVYDSDSHTWSLFAELGGLGVNAGFGTAVSLSADGNALAIGAPGAATISGIVYLYRRSGSGWEDRKELRQGSSPAGAAFGYSVSLNEDGSRLAAGAPLRTLTEGRQAGVAHTFDIASFWSDVLFTNGDQPHRLAWRDAHPEKTNGEMRPHQAFMLAFLRMLQTPRAMFNAIPAAHRQLYYRDLLGLKERPVTPDRVAVGFTLADGLPELPLSAGTLLDAGQDIAGTARQYRLEHDLLANQGQLTDLRWQRPAEDGGQMQTTRIVLDRVGGVPWPEGGVQLFAPDAGQDLPLETGRVVASPLLSMTGGERAITVTFAEAIDDVALITGQVSSGAGTWLPLTQQVTTAVAGDTIDFVLAPDAGAVMPPVGLDHFYDETPLLKLTRGDGLPVPEVIAIAVAVTQTPAVLYSTDEGQAVLDSSSYPFAYEPVIGAGFNLVSADWCGKPYPVTVTVTPLWADLPRTSFADWYADYPEAVRPDNNNVFKVQPSMVRRGRRVPLGEPVSLFASSAEETEATVPAGLPVSFSFSDLPAIAGDSGIVEDWQAWLRLELVNKDFLHGRYGQALQANPAANPPYTPQLSGLEVSYAAEVSGASLVQYVLTPFGYGPAGESNPDPERTPQAGGRYGYAVSISGNGRVMAVGEPRRKQEDDERCGAVWLFARADEQTAWRLDTMLAVPGEEHEFGCAVSLDYSGSSLVVGAHLGNVVTTDPITGAEVTNQAGTAYLYRREGGSWPAQGRKINPPTGHGNAEINFAHAVSISGDGQMIAIGAPNRWAGQAGSGRVYLYTGLGGYAGFTNPKVGEINAGFGASLSLNHAGTILAVGAPGAGAGMGAWCVVQITPTNSWPEIDGWTIAGTTANARLGHAISLSADGLKLAVSEPGTQTVYICTPDSQEQIDGAWSSRKQLSETAPDNGFGASLSLSANGLALAVGAQGVAPMLGNVYLYRRGADESSWTPLNQLEPADRVPGDGFGAAVSLSSMGNSLVVGAPLRLLTNVGNEAGAISTFRLDGSGGGEDPGTEPEPEPEPEPNYLYPALLTGPARFGQAVCISGDGNTLAVGAPSHKSLTTWGGAVVLFRREGSGWLRDKTLDLSDRTQEFRDFACSLSLDREGKTLVVGAYGENIASGMRGGAAYVFVRGASWSEEAVRIGEGVAQDSEYGYAVSISGDGQTIAVGMPFRRMRDGAVYTYHRNGPQWEEEQLTESGVYFGEAVSLDETGQRLAVGASEFGLTSERVGTGAAFVFVRERGAWVLPHPAILGARDSGFGVSVSISADGRSLIVGSRTEKKAHVYRDEANSGTWTPRQTLDFSASDAHVVIAGCSANGERLAVGVYGVISHAGSDAVYIYQRDASGQYAELGKLEPSATGARGEKFGAAVSLSGDGDRLAVGIPSRTYRGQSNAGACMAQDLSSRFLSRLSVSAESKLYLGFMGLQPGQDINLYWQLQSPQPLKLHWEYLNGDNRWQSLNAQVRDDTGGLFESALWSCVLPADAADNAAQMPPGRHWIRTNALPGSTSLTRFPASDPDPASDYPRLLGLHANAAMAVLTDGDLLDATHFEQALPAYTITRTVQPVAGLAEVTQPWPSFGGRGPESEAAFLQRAALRLQNRARVLSWRDVRNLLREHFPEIHDVRMPLALWTQTAAPGASVNVRQLVVIPANGCMDNNNALRPAFSPARLARMQAYLQQASSPWMQLVPLNPQYVDVMLDYDIVFKPGVNADYGYRQLRLALENRYMPWNWDNVSAVVLGDQLDYYDMVAFIQSQPWVERVRRFTLGSGNVSIIGKDDEVLILAWPDDEDPAEIPPPTSNPTILKRSS